MIAKVNLDKTNERSNANYENSIHAHSLYASNQSL